MSDWISYLTFPDRAVYLKGLAEIWGVEVKAIAEIGVCEGVNAKRLRLLFPQAWLYLIDPWEVYPEYKKKEAVSLSLDPQFYENAYQRVAEMFQNDSRCSILRTTSREGAPQVPDGLDLVFIDGNHSYEFVKEDIRIWRAKVKNGGILAGHDYDERRFPGIVRAVQEEIGEGNFLLGQDYVWAHLKNQ